MSYVSKREDILPENPEIRAVVLDLSKRMTADYGDCPHGGSHSYVPVCNPPELHEGDPVTDRCSKCGDELR